MLFETASDTASYERVVTEYQKILEATPTIPTLSCESARQCLISAR